MSDLDSYPVILAIDTTTEICSLALQTASGKIFEAAHSQSTHHTQAILPLLDNLTKEAQCTLKALHYIAVTEGPGSFTGVRAGIATTQGLAYGLGIPVIPSNSLELVALGIMMREELKSKSSFIEVIMDARMQQFYVASYRWEEGKCIEEDAPGLFSESDLIEHLSKNKMHHPDIYLVGTGVELIQAKLAAVWNTQISINTDPALNHPQAKNLILYLNHRAQKGHIVDLSDIAVEPKALSPLYIRDQVVN